MNRKRYLLISTDDDVTPRDWEDLGKTLEDTFGKIRLIPIEGDERLHVVKTDDRVASMIRRNPGGIKVGKSSLRTLLTSGSLGKLKKLAKETERRKVGQISQ
jgi:hypothetical protein